MGIPFGPGGTLRHGLFAYCVRKITTMVAMKQRRGVKSCESEAREKRPGGIVPAGLLSRVMVVYFNTREAHQSLFKVRWSLALIVSEGKKKPPNSDINLLLGTYINLSNYSS